MKNHIIELLNEAGYKNNNTNRERAVKNMNLLIDSGIMSLKLISAESYNSQENGKGFYMLLNSGIKAPTAYKVTLYGKTYYGHVMEKIIATKVKHTQNMDGSWEYAINTEFCNNTSISINEIQIRVAQLLSIMRHDKDFFAPKLFAAKGDCSCSKCNGVGIIPAFSYYANGICFDCGGVGINRSVLSTYIQENINSVK